jgi:polyisoprenoid-binding protein YceI/transposase-like protein
MSISNVHGHFGNIGGSIVLNESDISKSTVNITVDTSTVDTGVSARDNDLKSNNFFDVAQFPTATFVSTSIAKSANGMTVNGNLTLHGVTKPITLEVAGPTGPVPGMDHKPHSGFSGNTTIRRTDFGIAAKFPTAVVGDEVKLTIDLDVAKQWIDDVNASGLLPNALMRHSRFTEQQILAIVQRFLSGESITVLCDEFGISASTLYSWRSRHSCAAPEENSALNRLRSENRRLRRTIAEMIEEADRLKGIIRANQFGLLPQTGEDSRTN